MDLFYQISGEYEFSTKTECNPTYKAIKKKQNKQTQKFKYNKNKKMQTGKCKLTNW